ncbi:MAG: flagellar biosynthesis repressor FlbT [Alphaproteobacteria bacterium]
MPLKIVLKPHEKVVINQAVIANGPERTELLVENKANVLRQRDILTEETADTPARRIYFAVQMLYMFPESGRHYHALFNQLVRDFVGAVPSSTGIAIELAQKVVAGELYAALRICRKLVKYEEKVLQHGRQ